MKIIRQGVLPVEVFTGICTKCKCEVECSKSEATAVPDRNDIDYKVTCPTFGCGEAIWLKKK